MEFPALLVLRDILLQLAVERGLADAQHSRRQKLVAIELGNRAQETCCDKFPRWPCSPFREV